MRLLEHEPVVVQQLPLEADAVGAHARGEREPEVGAGQPAGEQLELEQRLSQARRGEPLAPLADRLDVVEPAARARHQAEVRLGAARRSAPGRREGNEPGNWRPISARYHASESRGASMSISVERDHVAPEHHRLQVEAAAVGQQARDPGEHVAVDSSWRPARCSSGEQKCSKAPRLATASNAPKLSRVTCRASWRWTSRPWRRQAAACAEDRVTPTPVAPGCGRSRAAGPSRSRGRARAGRARSRSARPRTRACAAAPPRGSARSRRRTWRR